MFYRPGWMDARVLRTAEEGLGLLMTWSCQVARGSPLALLLEGEAWGVRYRGDGGGGGGGGGGRAEVRYGE